jgi:KDO2-lipid IV(A) lauroyltransferase
MLELPYLRKMTADNLDRFATFVGVEHFQAALNKGKGLLFMTSHFGNWELMALAFCLKFGPSHAVVRPLDNPFFDRLISSIRCRGGADLIAKRGAVRTVLRLLRQGERVALLIDQNVDWYEGVFVPFFKEIACTIKMLTVVALRTGTPVVPAYNVRQPDGRYQVVFEPEVPLVVTGDQTLKKILLCSIGLSKVMCDANQSSGSGCTRGGKPDHINRGRDGPDGENSRPSSQLDR